ncbi:hypothetical protein R3P38DRAFT_3420853 [Favolaschia claudopus]|uniref:Gustatory receptor n=1 Tax=Favolaschia claudopus TaxID=2862362 RepID=A0AAW0D4Q7_9AGAR
MGANLSTEYVPSWQQSCANLFDCNSPGLVDIDGQSVLCRPNITNVALDSNVWGITYSACQEKCGMDMIRQEFNFTESAIPLVTWLLPWLTLIAQLPFEAVGWRNLLSACTCLGSPALTVYSLALTASNRVYIDKKFNRLKSKIPAKYGYLVKRLDSIAFVLKEAQQCPVRANQRHGELAMLLTVKDHERENFWKGAERDLKNTRRDFTYSFAAQVFMAFITYLFSFIAAVHDSLGSPDVALQFASSTVWSWMEFTVVFGYIRVGCQNKSGTVREALERDPSRSLNDLSLHQTALRPSGDLYEPLPQIPNTLPSTPVFTPDKSSKALPTTPNSKESFDTSGLNLRTFPTHQHAPLNTGSGGDDQTMVLRDVEIETPLLSVRCWGFDLRGEEIYEGPVFNYARVLTWFALTRHIERALATSIQKFRRGHAIPTTETEAAELCGFYPTRQDLAAYIPWSDIPHFVLKRMIFATVIALVLQWGSTGAAIYIAYNTEMVGIGCRSGSYLVYGIAATLSWLLLVASNVCSHAIMQRVEKYPTRQPGLLGALAVLTRTLGNTILVFNAGWLIASTILEEIGFFQTCWCQTNSFQFGRRGWTAVFKTPSDMRSAAGGVWMGGFIWSAVISVITSAIFAFGY